jgi:hypothetical protein
MTDMTEINTQEGTTEYKQIVCTTFMEVVFEIAKHTLNGWKVVQEGAYPFQHYNGLFEVNFIKNAETIREAAEKIQAAVDGKGVMTKEKRVEIMNNARKVRMDNLEKKKGAEAKE